MAILYDQIILLVPSFITALITALGSTITFFFALAGRSIDELLTIRLERVKTDIKSTADERLKKLEYSLKSEADARMAKLEASLKSEADERMARLGASLKGDADARMAKLGASLAKVERLEANLSQKRGDSYSEIWALTRAVNLFGKSNECEGVKLSSDLSDWYFRRGWALTDDAKTHYFLVQETLSCAIFRSIAFKRPDDEKLYACDESTVRALDNIRREMLDLPADFGDEPHKLEDIRRAVVAWKKNSGNSNEVADQQKAWVMFQLVLSSFRTRMAYERGTRQTLSTSIDV